jgi:hypothetical protein
MNFIRHLFTLLELFDPEQEDTKILWIVYNYTNQNNITYQQTSVFSDITVRTSELSVTALLYQPKLEFGEWYQYYFE